MSFKSQSVSDEEHRRACAALRRQAERHGHIYQQPANHSTVWIDEHTLSLSNERGVVGTVRVYSDGRMRAVEVELLPR